MEFNEEERLMLNMMYYNFYNNAPDKEGFETLRDGINKLLKNRVMIEEVCEILSYNYNHINFVDKELDLGFTCPLDLHCDYSRDTIMAAFGYFNEERKPAFREGVKYFN
ncbi:NgoFVII family restriction endonuclease, partial [Clostridium saudiense]|nr:NgoFVII family restriction endonuclease [Clostridium saudiense]